MTPGRSPWRSREEPASSAAPAARQGSARATREASTGCASTPVRRITRTKSTTKRRTTSTRRHGGGGRPCQPPPIRSPQRRRDERVASAHVADVRRGSRRTNRYGRLVHGDDDEVLELDGREVRLSSPGKVLFAERGETKRDLVEYYLRVGEPLLRTMGGPLDRCLRLLRRPDNSCHRRNALARDWNRTQQ